MGGGGVGGGSVRQLLFTATTHATETEPREYLERLAMASHAPATVRGPGGAPAVWEKLMKKGFMKRRLVHNTGTLCPIAGGGRR